MSWMFSEKIHPGCTVLVMREVRERGKAKSPFVYIPYLYELRSNITIPLTKQDV